MCVCVWLGVCVCAFLYAVKCNAYREKCEKKASRGREPEPAPAAAAATTVARTTNCALCREGERGCEREREEGGVSRLPEKPFG